MRKESEVSTRFPPPNTSMGTSEAEPAATTIPLTDVGSKGNAVDGFIPQFLSPPEKKEEDDEEENFEQMLAHVKEIHRVYDPDAPFTEKIQYIRRAWGLNRFFNFIIVLYFIFKCAQAQWEDSSNSNLFEQIESAFGVIFIIDVVIMLAAHWFFEFWYKLWNIFDFVIVVLTILDFAKAVNGRGFMVLRIFRVFDTLNRHRDFKVLQIATFNSMHKAAFLFLAFFVLMSMYSILGVVWFGDAMEDEFSTYDKAMFTMLQVLTGDSWSSAIARGAMDDKYEVAYIFFSSYMFFLAIILMNVVLAVFFDSYLTAHIEAAEDLERRKMRDLFDCFDKDKSGEISPDELKAMCNELRQHGFYYDPSAILAKIDVTSASNVLESDGMISFEEFLDGRKKQEQLKEMTLDKLNARLTVFMEKIEKKLNNMEVQISQLTPIHFDQENIEE